ARQAQVQGFADLLRTPSVLDGFAAEHFGEHTRPPAGGVYLVASDLVRRTHAAPAHRAARTHSDATVHRVGKRAVVTRQRVHRGEVEGAVTGAGTHVRVQRGRV